MSPPFEPIAPFDSPEHYHNLRLKLIVYFERRRCTCPEDLADECLNRVYLDERSREHGTNIDRFAFGFAANIYLEWTRDAARFTLVSGDFPEVNVWGASADRRRLLAEMSVAQLDRQDRELMEQYFLDGRTADSLAAEWGLSPAGVRSRVFRKRKRLIEFFLSLKSPVRETNMGVRDIND